MLTLIPDWRRILRRAWSVRLAIIAGLFSGAEVVLPLFVESLPRGAFAGLALLFSVGGIVARTVAQPRMRP